MNGFTFNPYELASTMACPYCGAGVEFKRNEVIYGKQYGAGFAYICSRFPDCDSFVGIFGRERGEAYGKPLGTLANAELRSLRKSVHRMVDSYWQSRVMRRKEVYAVIYKILNQQATNIAEFTVDQCRAVLDHWFDHVQPLHMIKRQVPKRF